MTLALPHIWVPRRDLWRPSLASFMAHLKKDPTSGHLVKKPSNGHLVNDCGCQGCPSTLTVITTGITTCGCVLHTGSGRYVKLASAPNGTYTITLVAGPPSCQWVGDTGVGFHVYSNSGCTTQVGTGTALISFTNNGTNSTLGISIGIISGLSASGIAFNSGTQTAACSGTYSNILTCPNNAIAAQSGSASFS